MTVQRIRNTKSQREYEQLIDEYITLGYTVQERGEITCSVINKRFGGLVSHIIIAILTAWWTFFIVNIIWLGYNYIYKSDKVLIRLDLEE